MKTVLFCQNAYAFGILQPIKKVLEQRKYSYLWYVRTKLLTEFPFENEDVTDSIEAVRDFESDAIFVPGNEVPHYLRGLKVQVFHGLAGEKKGHFRIRHYFDLYLTQGPYFTDRFLELKAQHKNFEVIETGWPKLDIYGKEVHKYDTLKKSLLTETESEHIILYAPTFSPSLTSGPYLIEHLEALAANKNYLILIKFHDLMAKEWVDAYTALSERVSNIIVEKDRNIIKYLLLADLMISDTSSVVYEFLLLNKPVVTFKCSSKQIHWDDQQDYANLESAVDNNLQEDPYRKERLEIVNEYHPYTDGLSADRMVNAVEKYIKIHGVPERRKLSWLRRRKINKLFGKLS